MITQQQLDADKAAVDAANAQLAKDQAAFDNVQPILTELANIEAYAAQLTTDVSTAVVAAVEKIKTLL